MADPLNRLLAAFKALLKEAQPNLDFFGVYRYSATGCDYEAQTVDATPASPRPGLPTLSKIPIRSWLKVEIQSGTSLGIGFLDGDPTQPYVATADQSTVVARVKLRADGLIEIGEQAAMQACRQGDMVLAGGAGTVATFYTPPGTATGIPLPITTEVPYFISFGNLLSSPPSPPTPMPLQSPLTGFTASGSVEVTIK